MVGLPEAIQLQKSDSMSRHVGKVAEARIESWKLLAWEVWERAISKRSKDTGVSPMDVHSSGSANFSAT